MLLYLKIALVMSKTTSQLGRYQIWGLDKTISEIWSVLIFLAETVYKTETRYRNPLTGNCCNIAFREQDRILKIA